MSVAVLVAWEGALLAVTDDAGVVHRYQKGPFRGNEPAAVVHVEGNVPHLRTGDDERPLLRQEGDGLPDEIRVVFAEPAGPEAVPGMMVWEEGGGNYLFRKV